MTLVYCIYAQVEGSIHKRLLIGYYNCYYRWGMGGGGGGGVEDVGGGGKGGQTLNLDR